MAFACLIQNLEEIMDERNEGFNRNNAEFLANFRFLHFHLFEFLIYLCVTVLHSFMVLIYVYFKIFFIYFECILLTVNYCLFLLKVIYPKCS